MGPLVLDGAGSGSFDFDDDFFSSSLASVLSFSSSSFVLSLFSSLSPASLACFSSTLLASSVSIATKTDQTKTSIS